MRKAPANFGMDVMWNLVAPEPNSGPGSHLSHLRKMCIRDPVARNNSATGKPNGHQDRSKTSNMCANAHLDRKTHAPNLVELNNVQTNLKKSLEDA